MTVTHYSQNHTMLVFGTTFFCICQFFFCLTVFQVNMPADSFESPLTLAACGGHVELADLLIKRGAFLEEVNDEGLVQGS